MEKETLNVNELQVGMYIELPGSWLSHDFAKSRFKITSNYQIASIKKQGINKVVMDPVKSDLKQGFNEADETGQTIVKDPRDEKAPKGWSSERFLTDELRNILEDRKLDTQVKAKAVYEHSLEMMDQLLEKPNKENLVASKEAIFAISDMVMAEPETSKGLLKIASHDYYTHTHSVNVGVMSIMLSKQIFSKHSDNHNLQELAAGFFLHDIGKADLDPAILNKPARLTDEEMAHIRKHPVKGYQILDTLEELTHEAKIIVMEHHESSDGKGYPRRSRDSDIHVYGKLCAIVDVFDALTAERSYKKAMSTFDALTLMKDKMGTRFDQGLFKDFVRIFEG